MAKYTREKERLVPAPSTAEGALPAGRDTPHEFMRPLVEQWLRKIEQAYKAREPFMVVAKQCDSFFSKASGFMWEDGFRRKHLGDSIEVPKWKVTLNKAFELVALFGPYLFWKYPQVWIESEERIDPTPELFADLFEDIGGVTPDHPLVQQMHQQAMQETQQESARQTMRNRLMQRYLNYSQREQPGGGLAVHAEIAITEALVKGRAPLWIEGYQMPGSGRMLTGRFWDKVDNLLIDPDASDPKLGDAEFIVRRHCQPDWRVEDLLDLPRGTFQKYGAGVYETAESQASNIGDVAMQHRKEGKAHNLVVWYEIWSKAGVGSRLRHMDDVKQTMLSPPLHDAFDDVVGDYAYLCIAPNVPFPLNAPSWKFRDPQSNEPRASDDEVREMFQWRAANYGPPFPCYLDDRWPVELLDFYRDYKSAWPIAPLAPAMGELVVLNVLISAFTEQAYENRKTIIAYVESAAKECEETLKSGKNPAFVKLNDTIHKDIKAIIQYLQRPEMNKDLLEAIAFVGNLFDKRTGLTEFMYAMSTTQSRTAKDVAAKEEKASIRPEKMANDVAHWLTESADLEKFLAGWTLEGQHLTELFGRWGSLMWDRLIVAEDPEVVVREMRATVQASDVRKPNKERLAQNLQEMQQYLVPMFQQYAQDTGQTEPLNAFLKTLGESMEQDMSQWELGPWQPQVPPEQQEQMQAEMQMEQLKLQTEVMIKQMEAQIKEMELQKSQVEAQAEAGAAQTEAMQRQLELAFDEADHSQELEASEETHEQTMTHDRLEFLQDLMQKRRENQQKIEQMKREGQVKVQLAKQQRSTNGSAA